MRRLPVAFIFFIAHFPLIIFASNELQYSSEYVDLQSGITLQEIWKRAVTNNPDILAANRKVLESKGLRKQAEAFPNPEIQINAGTSSILGEAGDQEWGASLAQTFELGGKRSKRIQASDLAVEIALQELREKERQVRWELQQVFADLLSAAATIKTTEEALKLNQQSHEITLARVRTGETAAVEQSVSEVELSRLKADLATLQAEVTRALSKMKLLTGLIDLSKIRPTLHVPLTNDLKIETLVMEALSSRPDFKIATLQVELSKTEISLAKAEAISDLDTFVEFSNERSAFDQFGIDEFGVPTPLIDRDKVLSGGISIKLPLFNRNQGNTQSAQARAESARIRKASLELTIRQEVQVAAERLGVSRANFVLFRDSIMDQLAKQLSILQASYRAGEFRFLDLINEQRRAMEIRKSYINASKEYLLAVAELEFVTSTVSEGGL